MRFSQTWNSVWNLDLKNSPRQEKRSNLYLLRFLAHLSVIKWTSLAFFVLFNLVVFYFGVCFRFIFIAVQIKGSALKSIEKICSRLHALNHCMFTFIQRNMYNFGSQSCIVCTSAIHVIVIDMNLIFYAFTA